MQTNTQEIIHSQEREQKDKKVHLPHLLPIEKTALKKDHKNMKIEQTASLDSQEGITKIQDPHHMREINIRKGQKHHPQEISSEPHPQNSKIFCKLYPGQLTSRPAAIRPKWIL